MDEVARFNSERWNALVAANALFTRPVVGLNAASAREMVDAEGRLGAIEGKDVLCLACGGGQQAIAFALMGARATVFDLSEAQLQRDTEAAAAYGVEVEIVQGDMRDLSAFQDATFDVVYHAYSLGFVPEARQVFAEVGRVLRPGGFYYFHCANPFYLGMTQDDWNGTGYTLAAHYVEGAAVSYADQAWVYERKQDNGGKQDSEGAVIQGAREYRHTLSGLIEGLAGEGFILLHLSDSAAFHPDAAAQPGTWSHFVSIAPPWLGFWTCYRPDVMKPS